MPGQIVVRVGGVLIPDAVQSVSRRGVFLRTDDVLAIGAQAQLIFFTAPCAALVLGGRVSWLEPQGGCGILFSAMPSFAHTMLLQLIDVPALQAAAMAG